MGVLSTYYKGFTFDGINSRAYGVYVADVNVFDAPERDVEMISVPGRNGDLTIDRGRFENIEVEYDCFVAGDDESDFNSAIANFRNALASRIGYKRLTDDFYPDEYRMASFISGVSVSQIGRRAGNFKISFNCMPQRFLLSGEVPKVMVRNMVPSSTKTETGSVVSIQSDGGDAVTSLIAQITPTQAGSGDPSPTNVRPITGWTAANVNVAGKNLIDFKSLLDKWGSMYTDLGNDSYNVASIGTGYREPFRFASEDIDVTLSGEITQLSGSAGWRLQLLNSSDEVVATLGAGSTTLSGNGCKLRLNYSTAGGGANYRNIQLELGTAATGYEHYTGTTTTTALGRTVYGGTVDVVTGVLTVTHAMVDLGTLTWTYRTNSTKPYFTTDISDLPLKSVMRCSIYKQSTLLPNNASMPDYSMSNQAYFATAHNLIIVDSRYTDAASFKTAMNGVQLCYELATPQTYNLTAQDIELLTGNNNLWADTGDITITWGDDPYKVVNPTLFDAKPLIEVTGHGVLTIGSQSITINGTSSTQVIYIDCDTMEAWEMSGSAMIPRNDYIRNAGDDFPVLVPGANKITLGVGITRVVFTPRWWRV